MADGPNMTPVNPRCTAFCTGGRDDIRGHPDTSPAAIAVMLGQLVVARVKAEPSRAAVDLLYRKGHGYHAIADALGISHEEGFKILTGQCG